MCRMGRLECTYIRRIRMLSALPWLDTQKKTDPRTAGFVAAVALSWSVWRSTSLMQAPFYLACCYSIPSLVLSIFYLNVWSHVGWTWKDPMIFCDAFAASWTDDMSMRKSSRLPIACWVMLLEGLNHVTYIVILFVQNGFSSSKCRHYTSALSDEV